MYESSSRRDCERHGQAARDVAFAPTVSVAGDTLPYGLGWFSTRYKGERVV